MRSPTLLAAALLSLLACGAYAQATDSAELHRLITDKQFSQALQKITAGLALKGPAAQTVDRYELLMLKGECHLQTKAASTAIDAFTAAAKEAANDHDKSLAQAHIILLKASRAFAYTPKLSADKTRLAPIDILDPASRRRAFLAMFLDELSANDAKLKSAKSAKTLPPIAAAFKPLDEMEALELASKEPTAELEKVKSIRHDLAESAQKLIADALRTMSKRVGIIDKEANTFVEFYQDVPNPYAGVLQFRKQKAYRKKGLTDAQSKDLQATTATCDKLNLALTELATGLKVEEKTFDPFAEEAAHLRKEVDRILDTDYQKVYDRIPR